MNETRKHLFDGIFFVICIISLTRLLPFLPHKGDNEYFKRPNYGQRYYQQVLFLNNNE